MKKFLVFMLAMLWMSVAAFSQITISQEDYDRLPGETRTQIEKITTEKAIKGEIKEVSEYASLGKEIGVPLPPQSIGLVLTVSTSVSKTEGKGSNPMQISITKNL